MNLAIAAAVFPIIFLGELPDKSMFASLVMASKGKALTVWAGAAAAFLLHVVIAVTIGVGLFHLLPKRVLEAVVAALFLGGAIMAIIESRAEEEAQIEREEATHGRTAAVAFGVIFVAEWGDLTQILTANLAAHYRSGLSVAVGAVAALWAVAGIAVIGGKSLLRYFEVATIRLITAAILLALAAYTAWSAITG